MLKKALVIFCAAFFLVAFTRCLDDKKTTVYDDTAAPHLAGASFFDADSSRTTSGGDYIILYFNKDIRLNSADMSSFYLPVSGDSLLGATVEAVTTPTRSR